MKVIKDNEEVGSCVLAFRVNLEESFGMPQPAAALSITNMMNPHLFFFFFISVETAHRRLPRVRPPELGGGVAATESVRKNKLGRKKKGVRRNAAETRLATRKRRGARGQRPGSVRSSPRWISQGGPAKLACSSQVPSRYPPSLLPIPSIPPRKIPNGKFRTPPNFSFLILFPSLAECRKHICAWAPRSQECG